MGHPDPSYILKMIQNGPINNDKNINLVISSIQKIISNFDLTDILYWVSALSILPGNEIYEKRFEFLVQVVLSSIKILKGNKKVTNKIIFKLLDELTNLNWIMFEDWAPIKLDKNRKIFFRDKWYHFFPYSFEFPENTIESIARFSIINDQFENTIGYSPVNELGKILTYQNDIIEFIFDNQTNYQVYKKIQIPTAKFVKKWEEYQSNNISIFSKKFTSNLSIKEVKKPSSSFFNEQNVLEKYPIYDNIILLPSQLIYTLLIHIREDYSKISNKQNQEIMKDQLKRSVLLSLLEIVPLEAILTDFTINDIKEKIDFGIIHDDKFFFFNLLDDVFTQQEFKKNIEKALSLNNQIVSAFNEGNIQLYNEEISDNLEPIFILLLNDSLLTMQIITDESVGQQFECILSESCLRHIFEDLADKEEDLTLFTQILYKYRDLRKDNIVIISNFCDFYEMAQSGYLAPRHGIILIDPNAFTEKANKKINKRPRMDLTPYLEYPPFTFRIRKIEEMEYYGNDFLIKTIFFVFLDNFQIFFLIDLNMFTNQSEIIFVEFLSKFYMFILKQLQSKNLIKKDLSKKIIRLIPFKFASQNNIGPISNNEYQILKSVNNDNEIGIVYDFDKIVDKISSNDLDAIIIQFLSIIEELCVPNNIDKIIDMILTLELNKKFNVSKVTHYDTNIYTSKINYPTKINEIDVEKIIYDFVKYKYKDGIYFKNDANDVIKDIVSYLEQKIMKDLELYDLDYFITLAYSENENVIITRIKNDIEYLSRKDMIINYDPIQVVIEHEEKSNWYGPSCRYLIETKLTMNKNGVKKISIFEWKKLIALTKKYLNFINLSDFFYFLSIKGDYLDIKLEVNTTDGWVFHPIFRNNPFEKFNKEMIEGRKLANLEEEYPAQIEELSAEEIFERGEELFNNKEFGEIDLYLQKNFGFRQLEYGLVLNAVTHLSDRVEPNYLVKINRDELIDFLHTKTKLNKLIITNIIDFSTISESNASLPKYGKINTRENRLTIKPFVRLKDTIIFGISTVVTCATLVIRQFTNGEWPYSYEEETFPISLKNKLIELSRKTSSKFENSIYESISKHTQYIEKNLCRNPGENDKCLENVCEACIGEIDVLSLHPKLKTAIVWEIKKVAQKFGSREICYDVEEFLSEKGYASNLRKKQEYINRNITDILDYYQISDKKNWKIESVFVFSSLSVLKNIVSEHHPAILWDEIDSYLRSKDG